MATRSSISIRNADGSYTGIYCQYDGYLSGVGHTLEQHYTDEDRIRQLMALGNLSSLGAEIGERHEFDNPHRYSDPGYQEWQNRYGNWCTAYGRDRGERNQAARRRATLVALLSELSQEYDYLWDEGRWKVRCHATDNVFVDIDDARRLQQG